MSDLRGAAVVEQGVKEMASQAHVNSEDDRALLWFGNFS